nr:hypothetical protein [Candidatus Freyarchaeota archaeon]
MSVDSFLTTILGGAIAGVTGLASALYVEARRRKNEATSTKRRVLRNLISEMDQNRSNQTVSPLNPLSCDAWEETKRAGVSLELGEELRNELTVFYSLINYKNSLLVIYTPLASDAWDALNPTDPYRKKEVHSMWLKEPYSKVLIETISNLTVKIGELISPIIDKLKSELEAMDSKRKKG